MKGYKLFNDGHNTWHNFISTITSNNFSLEEKDELYTNFQYVEFQFTCKPQQHFTSSSGTTNGNEHRFS